MFSVICIPRFFPHCELHGSHRPAKLGGRHCPSQSSSGYPFRQAFNYPQLRCPLYRHFAQRRAPPSPRRRLLCPKSGREPDQDAQGPARLGPPSCQSPLTNQLRLVLHSAAYWLMLALRDAIPRVAPLARVEFATLRLRLLKIGARVIEKATRVRIHFTSACPDAALFRLLAGRLATAGP